MPVESATYAIQLSATQPAATDPRSEGDDHLRLIKSVLNTDLGTEFREWAYTALTATWRAATRVSFATDETDVFTPKRRVRAAGAATGTLYGAVASSTYSASTTVNFRWDESSLSNEALQFWVGTSYRSLPGPITPYAFGAKGDGNTDDYLAFQNWAKHLNATKGVGYVPGVAQHYAISQHFIILDDVTIYGDGPTSHVRNTNVTGSFSWKNSVCLFGTVFGFNTGTAFHDELATTLSSAAGQGDETIAVTSATGFSSGKIIMVEDNVNQHTVGGIDYPRHAQMNEVIGVSGTTITLKYPLTDDYPSGALVAVEDGSVSLINGADVQGETVNKMARRSTIRDMKFSTAEKTGGISQCMHISTFECLIENLHIDGADAFGINPCAYTTFRGVRASYYGKGFECAYAHNNVLVDDYIGTRVGNETANNDRPMTFSESGQDVLVTNFQIYDYDFTGGDIPVISATTRRVCLSDGFILAGQLGGIAFTGSGTGDERRRCFGSVVRGVRILDPTGNGIDIDSDGVTISDTFVQGTPSGKVAVEIDSSVTICTLRDLTLGEPGATTSRDYVKYAGTGGEGMVFENIRSHLSHHGEYSNALDTFSSASAHTAHEFKLQPDTTARLGTWSFRSSGSFSGTNGAKKIELNLGAGSTVATLSATAAATGSWWIEGQVTKQTNSSQQYRYTAYAPAYGLTAGAGTITQDMVSATFAMALVATLAHDDDTIFTREWAVVPENDQYDDI